ncbi:MAG TPA: MHYT domain-containing protein, partial [Candidatus Acidoferrum sp.]|nr:MHYT domain-containing protein [Candidatus Acidoferrum sp.]
MAPNHAMALASGYNAHLVALSIAIAVVAAYVAFALAERVTENRAHARYQWLIGGAIVMGSGIWLMHFTGMLAFHVPLAVGYDVPLVTLSLLAAVVSSGIALYVSSGARMSLLSWLVGGVLMGSGIAAMHYIGMAAMRMPAMALWDGPIVAISVLLAVTASLVALLLVFRLRRATPHVFDWRRVSAAAIMGIAIAGMHYTGMAAATFVPVNSLPGGGPLVVTAQMNGTGIALLAFIGLGLALAVTFVDRRLTAQESALAVSQRHLHTVVANAPVVIIALDPYGTVTMAEGQGLAALGNDPGAMIGRSFSELYHHVPALVEQARRALSGEPLTANSTINDVVLETRWVPLRDHGASVTGVIAVATDITERRRVEIALKHQALHDALTDLPNRSFFHERLETALRAAEKTRGQCCLGLIDLDRFKEVNDTLGHHVGDALLEQVARRLKAALRETDVAARLGGDEFAFLLSNVSEAQAIAIGRELLATVDAPYVVGDRTLDIRGSLGLAVYPVHGRDSATLLRHADVAMYVAKRDRLGYAVYDPAKDRHDGRRLTMQADMRGAIARGDFELHYQPQVDFESGKIGQVEALIRWRHPAFGLMAPDQFIPLAEETELIIPLTRWVLEAALSQLR